MTRVNQEAASVRPSLMIMSLGSSRLVQDPLVMRFLREYLYDPISTWWPSAKSELSEH
jgi:hypothetical protein